MSDYRGLHFQEDIEKNLKKLGYTSLRQMLEKEYPKQRSSTLAAQMEVTKRTINKWLRRFKIPIKPRGGTYEHIRKAATHQGRPCKLGHTLRYVNDKSCVECHRIRNKKHAEEKRKLKNVSGT